MSVTHPTQLPDLTTLSSLVAEYCVTVPVAQGPAALARELARLAPQLSFREVLARGGWYRLGGVVDGHGRHVASDLERWAGEALERYGEDLAAMASAYADDGLRATRFNGKTHFWVARIGPGAADFIQIEIEELQEVICHALFPDGEAPASLEELVDPCDA